MSQFFYSKEFIKYKHISFVGFYEKNNNMVKKLLFFF